MAIDLRREEDRIRQLATAAMLQCESDAANAWALLAIDAIGHADRAVQAKTACTYLEVGMLAMDEGRRVEPVWRETVDAYVDLVARWRHEMEAE